MAQPPEKWDDDDAEIEVSHAPQPARKPRRSNPAVDEVIHSGEIVVEAPRSSIIRSGSMPSMSAAAIAKVDVELKAPSAQRRARFIWLVTAGVAALAGGGLWLFDRPPPESDTTAVARVQLAATAQAIGTTLDAAARAVMVRAEAIASSSMLRAGIETDAQTLADMARDHDMTFPVSGAEVLEVHQLRDNNSMMLLRIPATAAAIADVPAGKTRIEASGGVPVTAATASVSDQKSVRGSVTLAVPIDLARVKAQLGEQTTTAWLVGLGAPIPLRQAATDAPVVSLTVPIETEDHAKLSLEASVVIAMPVRDKTLKWVRIGCFGLAALLSLIFIGTSLRRSSRTALQ